MTAAGLWHIAGPDMWLYRWSMGLAYLQGKGDRCAMTPDEYADYQAMRERYAKPWIGDELDGAPSISMRVVCSEEDAEMLAATRIRPAQADLQRIYTSLADSLSEVKSLVRSAQQTLSVDGYGDALAGAMGRLELCRQCVDALKGGEAYQLAGEDELEALDAWHKAEAEECVEDLLRGVPVEGGNVSRNDLRNLILSGFLSGAVEQLTRPLVRQPKTGGPEVV